MLLWDAKEDLVRALLVLRAALNDVAIRMLLLAPGVESAARLRELIEPPDSIRPDAGEGEGLPPGGSQRELWLLFLQQASSEVFGPLLNGWRTPLRQAPGTILAVRRADFDSFQRHAPDLASFVGPRIYDASTMLSVVSDAVQKRLQTHLPPEFARLLAELPGTTPDESELRRWIEACAPVADE